MAKIAKGIIILCICMPFGCTPTQDSSYLGMWSTEKDRRIPFDIGPGEVAIEITHDTFTSMRRRGTVLSEYSVSDSTESSIELSLPSRRILIEFVEVDHIRIDGQDYYRAVGG